MEPILEKLNANEMYFMRQGFVTDLVLRLLSSLTIFFILISGGVLRDRQAVYAGFVVIGVQAIYYGVLMLEFFRNNIWLFYLFVTVALVYNFVDKPESVLDIFEYILEPAEVELDAGVSPDHLFETKKVTHHAQPISETGAVAESDEEEEEPPEEKEIGELEERDLSDFASSTSSGSLTEPSVDVPVIRPRSKSNPVKRTVPPPEIEERASSEEFKEAAVH